MEADRNKSTKVELASKRQKRSSREQIIRSCKGGK